MRRLFTAGMLLGCVLACVLAAARFAEAASFDATVAWTDNSTNETGFNIYRKAGGGTYSKVGSVAQNVVTFTDTGLAVATQYCYQIGAFNAVNEVLGVEACATTGSPVVGAPGAPTINFIFKP